MSRADEPDDAAALAVVIGGCLTVWGVAGRVAATPDGAATVAAEAERLVVRPTGDGWEVRPGDGEPGADGPRADGPRADGPRADGPGADGPGAAETHASVLTLLRALRLRLAPDRPAARMIVVPGGSDGP
ncbi:MAG: hypothetical protein ACK4QW_11615 [Alphaproteobacteria bacterium]